MASTVTETGTQTTDVKAKYVDNVNRPAVYSVDVSWSSMEYTYKVNGTKTWDPATHTYTDDTEGNWENKLDSRYFQVTNHSNVNVTVSWALAIDAAYQSYVNAYLRDFQDAMADGPYTSKVLSAGVENKPGEADYTIVELMLDYTNSTLPETLTEMTKIGTITVTIA